MNKKLSLNGIRNLFVPKKTQPQDDSEELIFQVVEHRIPEENKK